MPDSPTFRPTSMSSFASTVTMSQSTSGSSFPSDDDLLADELFGAADDGHNDTSMDDDDSVLVNFPSAAATSSTATTLSHSNSLSSFPDLSGDPSSVQHTSQQQQERSAEDNKRLLSLHCSTHLSLCIKHLLVAHRLSTSWQPALLSLTQQAVSSVRPDMRKGDMMDIRHYVHIQPIPGGRKEDSTYVDGVAFQHSLPAPSTMVRYSIDNPRVLLFAGAIEPPFKPSESRLFSSLLDSAQGDAERDWLDKRLPSVLFLRPDIIFVERHVSRYVAEALRGAGVSLVTGVELGMLERIARCTQATVLNGLDDVDGRYLGRTSKSGQVRVEEYGILIDEGERQDEDDERKGQQQQPKKQETEIELSDLFSGTTVKQAATTTHLRPPANSFDPFGGLLDNSPPPPSTGLTSTSPATNVSILGSSFYNVGSANSSALQQQGAGSFKDLFSGLSVRDSTPPASSSPFSPKSAASHRSEPTYVPFFFLRGCQPSAHCTLVLRGSRSLTTLHKLQRVVQLAVHIAYSLSLEQILLFETGVTYTPHSLAAMEQKAIQNIEQARVAMQAVEEGGGPPQYMTLISSSPHITLPPIPFYPSLLNYRAHFPLPLPPHLQSNQPAVSAASSFKPNNASNPSQQPTTAVQPSASAWSQPATRDLLNFSTTPLNNNTNNNNTAIQPPFDPSQLSFSSLPPPTCTALMQSNLLVGSCWFTSSGQCRSPDLKQIDFYSTSDKTLADFLFSNCFDVQARCVNPTCKKDIFRHVLAYTHNDGRLLITVKQRRPEGAADVGVEGLGLPVPGPPSRSTSSPLTAVAAGDAPRAMSPQPPNSGQSSPPPSLQYSPTNNHRGLPLPAPPVLQANKQLQPPRGSATVTHAATPTHAFSFNQQTNQPPSSAVQQPLNSPSHPPTNPTTAPPAFSSNTLITWSRCKLCGHRVTPYTPLSAASLSYSFGKYLDLTFNNLTAMSTCASCPHPVHTAHVRYVAIGNVVACFEYEKAQPFAVVARPRVKYDRSEVMEGRLVHLSTLAMVSKQVFDEFLTKIGEIEANSRSAAFKDLLQQLHAKVKHEEDTFTAFYKRHGLKVAMLDNLAALNINMSAEKSNAALVQSLVEGGVDDEANALFGDERSPTGDERREQRPLLDTFDVHRLHRKLVLSFIEWNKMLTEMCSFIFPKGWEDSVDSTPTNTGAVSGAVGTGAGGEENKERHPDLLQINIERSAHRLPPAPTPFNRDSATSPSPSPNVRQPASPSLPFSNSREPLTPTLFSSLHAAPTASTAAPPAAQPNTTATLASSVSPNPARSRVNDGGQSGPLLDTAQLRSMLSNVSDMFGGSGSRRTTHTSRSFKPNVTVDDLTEHNPKLRDVVTELIAAPLGHGHFSLPHCVGGIAVPVYDDEPSSIIAYTLASFEHLQLVNPSKVDEMKQPEKDRAAAEAERQQQTNGAAAHVNGRTAAPRPTNGEINFFDDAVHVGRSDGLLVIDNYVNPTPATGTADLFDLSSFGASPPIVAAAPVHLSAAPPALYKPSPFSFASPVPAASPLAAAVQQSSQATSAPVDNHRSKLLGAVGPRSSISSPLYVHPHSQWFTSDRPEWAVEQCMLSGFTDKDKEELTLKFKFEDLPNHSQQPGDQLTQFKCIAFFPRHFHALRSHTTNGDYDFIQSMSRSDKWSTTGGKSGSTFSKTSDDRYVLKYVKKLELDMFLDISQHYFAHMAKVCFHQLPSVLVKILGVYTLSWQRGKKEGMSALHVIVMPNLFYQKTNVKVFDLKGSERNRYIKQPTPATVAPTAQLPPLGPSSSSSSSSSSSLSVLSTPTSSSPPPPTAPAESSHTLLDLNLWEYTHGLPIPVHESSHSLLRICLHNDSYFLSGLEVIDYSLLVGFDHVNGELLVGVIDYIRQYNWAKRLETGVKSMGRFAGQAEPTIVNPTSYKQRFRSAMERYFMIAPDQCSWFRKVQEREDDNITSYALREEQEEKESSGRKGKSNQAGSSSSGGSDKSADRPGSASQSEKPSGSKMGMFKWGKE